MSGGRLDVNAVRVQNRIQICSQAEQGFNDQQTGIFRQTQKQGQKHSKEIRKPEKPTHETN